MCTKKQLSDVSSQKEISEIDEELNNSDALSVSLSNSDRSESSSEIDDKPMQIEVKTEERQRFPPVRERSSSDNKIGNPIAMLEKKRFPPARARPSSDNKIPNFSKIGL